MLFIIPGFHSNGASFVIFIFCFPSHHVWQSLGRISIHFYLSYLWLELSQLPLFSGRHSLSSYLYWLGTLAVVEQYMLTCGTFKFPKTQVDHIHVIKPKHIKSESDLKDHGLHISPYRWIKSRHTAFSFWLRHTDIMEEWWTRLIPWQSHYGVEMLVLISSHS